MRVVGIQLWTQCGVSVMGPTSESAIFGRSRALTLSMEMDGRPVR